ncbi:hypothetical protein PV10_01860 [Exophiala mesophila]|uniref:Rhodanese domain-containing protein n=1 Tax=Exophiala mesophila TaxID=212818 RepID=A0A0D1ZUH4_EXOME|nr:uncharacterized protein PV10_01860 [Exophiala mesophila]KIV98182.1 hypothetical protein PV10_01860 [Exophiala mesophila]
MASKRGLCSLTRSLHRTSCVYSTTTATSRFVPLISPLTPLIQEQQRIHQAMPRMRQPRRHFHTTLRRNSNSDSSAAGASKQYTFAELQKVVAASAADPHTIIVDVREPAELESTGRIPTAVNIPISSAADSFFLPADEFEERFGIARPGDKDHVIFYCKAGVRSRAAAALARQAGFGGDIAEFPGSWIEWFENGGEVER